MYFVLALAAFLVILCHCLFYFKRTPSSIGKKARRIRAPVESVIASKRDAPYEISDLHSPVIKGRLLQFLIRVAYTPFGKWLFINDSMKKSNGDLMGGEYIPEDPSFTDISAPRESESSGTNYDHVNELALNQLPRPVQPIDGFRYNTILDYHHAYKDKKFTPTDVARRVLKAMKESNGATPPLLAVVEWDESVVLAMAEASTDRWEKGAPLSYLDGVPVAIKGELLVEPYPLMGGAKFKSAVCENIREGEMLKRLREAGAVLIGITNMQEFGTGTIGSNPNYGIARNPHNPAHYCGGSSSGSASSVAAGLCPLALGADGGGSVRIPASLCGITGLKPTSSLLDTSGVIHIAYTVGVLGPLASSSLDVAIAMNVLLKGSGKPFSLQGLGSSSLLSGMKIGVYSSFFRHADAEVIDCCEKSVRVLEGLGAEVKEIVIPELEELRTAHLCLIASEMYNNLSVDVDNNFNKFNPETLLLLRIAQGFSAKEYINSLKQRTRGLRIMEDAFSEVDLIVLPSCSIPSPQIKHGAVSHGIVDAATSGHLMRFMFLANITGLPAISVPVGCSKAGLPIGLQLIAPWHEDGLLVKVGNMLEKELEQVMKKPKVYYNLLEKIDN